MKVYVVVEYDNLNGNINIAGVFDNEEQAKQYVDVEGAQDMDVEYFIQARTLCTNKEGYNGKLV